MERRRMLRWKCRIVSERTCEPNQESDVCDNRLVISGGLSSRESGNPTYQLSVLGRRLTVSFLDAQFFPTGPIGGPFHVSHIIPYHVLCVGYFAIYTYITYTPPSRGRSHWFKSSIADISYSSVRNQGSPKDRLSLFFSPHWAMARPIGKNRMPRPGS